MNFIKFVIYGYLFWGLLIAVLIAVLEVYSYKGRFRHLKNDFHLVNFLSQFSYCVIAWLYIFIIKDEL